MKSDSELLIFYRFSKGKCQYMQSELTDLLWSVESSCLWIVFWKCRIEKVMNVVESNAIFTALHGMAISLC